MLQTLPAELLYAIQLFALSETLPYTNGHCYDVFNSATPSYKASYIIGKYFKIRTKSINASTCDILTYALLFPLCNISVLEALVKNAECPPLTAAPLLPKRLFRPLRPTSKENENPSADIESSSHMACVPSEKDEPLPFLRYLYDSELIPDPDPDSHEGYCLTRAVHANFTPLVRFLLYHGASPHWKEALPLKVAIRKKNLSLVQMLIERDTFTFDAKDRKKGSRKRRKMEDRIVVTNDLLKDAIRARARDIVAYFVLEKHVIADSRNLSLMAMTGDYANGLVSSS